MCLFVSDLIFVLSLVPSISPSWSPTALNVKTVPASLEGLGMASTLISSGQVLLTGGSSRGGRGTVTRILLRGQEGWRAIGVQPSVDLSEGTVFVLWVVIFALSALHLQKIHKIQPCLMHKKPELAWITNCIYCKCL